MPTPFRFPTRWEFTLRFTSIEKLFGRGSKNSGSDESPQLPSRFYNDQLEYREAL
jgi:hypothetical protein